MFTYFKVNNLFYNHQYGFREGHSTELAALELVDRVIQNLDKDDIPFNVYLDLSKAFDTLDYSILIEKLKYCGINHRELSLFKSYLANRKQFVDIEGTTSDMLSLTTGVPQGSVLRPLLFIIYMNDISSAKQYLQTHHLCRCSTLTGIL